MPTEQFVDRRFVRAKRPIEKITVCEVFQRKPVRVEVEKLAFIGNCEPPEAAECLIE